MILLVLFVLLLYASFLIGVLAALGSGIGLGCSYLHLLWKRKPLPSWTLYIRIGWYACATGISSLLTFKGDFVPLFGGACFCVALILWLFGLSHWRQAQRKNRLPTPIP